MIFECNECESEFETPITCTVFGIIFEACPECASIEIKEKVQYCSHCSGTGISSSGPVDQNCSMCKGTGFE